MVVCILFVGEVGVMVLVVVSGQVSFVGKVVDVFVMVVDMSVGCVDVVLLVQILVCRDLILISLDVDVGKVVIVVQVIFDVVGQSKLYVEQQCWQEYICDLCIDVQCLQQVYIDCFKVLFVMCDGLIDQDVCEVFDGQQ